MQGMTISHLRVGRVIAAALMAFCCWFSMGCAAATKETADTRVIWENRLARLTPAKAGQDSVWVDYQDITGGTEDLLPIIEDAVAAKGYSLADSHEEADLVLWATLRFFDEINENTTAAYNAARAGAIIGGGGGAVVGYSTAKRSRRGVSAVGGGIAGAAVGAAVGYGISKLNAEHQYEAIIDVQLARKKEGGVNTSMNSSEGVSSTERQGSASNIQNTGRTNSSNSNSSSGQSQSFSEQKVHFERENRMRVVSKGRRLARNIAFDAIREKIVAALPSTLPRPPRKR